MGAAAGQKLLSTVGCLKFAYIAFTAAALGTRYHSQAASVLLYPNESV
jgi:hypothetical protein